LRDVTCDICSWRYGVYAAALFCPDYGARNVHVHFRREIELIHQQVDMARKVGDEGNRELAYRLIGKAHEDVLTAFEAYHKAIYKFLVQRRVAGQAEIDKLCSKKHIRNAFQRIDGGRGLYARFSFDPFGNLAPAELEVLDLNIQKRHVLGHNLGVVDEAYSELARACETEGQTVRVLADEIAQFATICEKVIRRLEEESPEFLPPNGRI
jgi:hypothetical protein